MKLTDIISILSLIVSTAAMCISLYSALEPIRRHKLIIKQKYDLIVRPRGEYRMMPPAKLMNEIEQIGCMPQAPQNTINKDWEKETLAIVLDDIGDNGIYYGIVTKKEIDPIEARNKILVTRYFDKAYITAQGKKKHKLIIKRDN